MINSITRDAFSDELTKIAIAGGLLRHLGDNVHRGWESLDAHGHAPEGSGWWYSKGRIGSKIPMGAKSMTVLGGGLLARDALKREDPTGRGRSRFERLIGAGANIVGGMAATGALMKRPMFSRHPLLAGMAGGLLGGTLAEKTVTAPWAIRRKMQQQQRVRQQAFQEQRQSMGYPDERWQGQQPAHSPDAVEGQSQLL